MSTHNLCFGSKVKKYVYMYPCKPQLYCIKLGFNGVYISRTCFPDGNFFSIDRLIILHHNDFQIFKRVYSQFLGCGFAK